MGGSRGVSEDASSDPESRVHYPCFYMVPDILLHLEITKLRQAANQIDLNTVDIRLPVLTCHPTIHTFTPHVKDTIFTREVIRSLAHKSIG